MNSDGEVDFLKAGLEKTLKETTRQQTAVMETAWLEAFPMALLQDSTQIQLHEKLSAEFKGSGKKAAIKTAKRKGRGISLSYLKFLKVTFFITNVPATLWTKEAVGTIYRLRRTKTGIDAWYMVSDIKSYSSK